jgi:CheY-like chemotaxis protein
MTEILLVEDDIVSAKFLRHSLERDGYRVHWADNCESARRISKTLKPSLILLDFGLPDGDGLSLTAYFRSRPDLAHVPLMMCTACDEETTLNGAFQAGVSDFLRKPCRPTELRVRVANAIRLYEARLEVAGLQQSKTMMSMASLVAHELNNPLAAAYHWLGALGQNLSESGDGPRNFERLHQVLDRICTLVVDMRTLALINESTAQCVSLSEVLRLACRLLSVRSSRGLWVRPEIIQDSQIYAHPGLAAQALVAVCGYWLDVLEGLGGGGLAVRLCQDEKARLELALLLDAPAEVILPDEPPELVLAKRQLAELGASWEVLPAGLTLSLPRVDNLSVITKEADPNESAA